MKRYWKILSLCMVTVLVIGAFYTQSGLKAKENTKIDFKKVSGNDEEVAHLMINADLEVGNLYQSLQITNNETINLNSQSVFQKLARNSTVPVVNHLIEQYRTFMRGKEVNPNYFYEDKELVAFAAIITKDSRDSSFDIDLLNKKSKETTSFQLAVPKSQPYSWMEVVDVQVNDGNLKVIARGARAAGGSDLNIYTMNIDEQRVVRNEVVYTAPAVKNGWIEISVINDYYSIQPEKWLLFKVENYEDNQAQGEGEMAVDGEPKLVVNDVMVYDLENNQSKKIMAADEVLRSISNTSAIFQSTMYIPSIAASGFEVSKYDLEKDKWGKKLTVDLPIHTDNNIQYIKLMNGKVYIIQATNHHYTLSICDLLTGKSLYEGELIVKNTREGEHDFLFHVNDIGSVQ
ncbi:hypothetical protein [Neobacillus drentensis]|uniref:hypothetical protein n=1 Tax=Neobacillus drentensis TaxID=220684 RepID=UPI0030004BEA